MTNDEAQGNARALAGSGFLGAFMVLTNAAGVRRRRRVYA